MDQYRPPQLSSSQLFPPPDNTVDNVAAAAAMKAPKRKRLAKACDACHKSKRRCDGTAPCSNCYYASKSCTYTDANGRPVPAPRPFKPERLEPEYRPLQPAFHPSSHALQSPHLDHVIEDEDHIQPHPNPNVHNGFPRKRFRNDRGAAVPSENISTSVPRPSLNGSSGPPSISLDRPAPVELDHPLVRELTNLFFTHCHPVRIIIHKPTFASSLAHSRVPPYLLHAICAVAAPLSKQPRLRTTPARFAGRPFAQEALTLMFDGAGRLMCERNLATAQALCLLQVHDVATKDKNMFWDSRYHDLALQIVESMNVYQPDYPTLTPLPSQEFVQGSIERESLRRIFWLIYFMDVLAHIFFKKPMVALREQGLRLRLPADETTFELGVSSLPEFLYLAPIKAHYCSEFGHLIRVITIYDKIEVAMDELSDPETTTNPLAVLTEAEQRLESWAASLSEHLRFSDTILQIQQSMFETSSNTGAWCWCMMHVLHASSALALSAARQRGQRGPTSEPGWAVKILYSVMDLLGDRAKNSFIMGAVLWTLLRYGNRDDPKVLAWSAEYENAWGTRMRDLAIDSRSNTPPLPQQQVQQQHRQAQSPTACFRPPSHQHDSSYTHIIPMGSSTTPFPNKQHSHEESLSNRTTPSHSDWDGSSREYPSATPIPISDESDEKLREDGSKAVTIDAGRAVSTDGPQPQSLPSLKSCGLLDLNSRVSGVPLQPINLGQRQSPLQRSIALLHEAEGRNAGLVSMPVGLPWLANESR